MRATVLFYTLSPVILHLTLRPSSRPRIHASPHARASPPLLTVLWKPSLVDLAEASRVIGVDDSSPRRPAPVEVRVVQQVGVEVDHVARPQRHRHDLVLLDTRRVDLEVPARLEGI